MKAKQIFSALLALSITVSTVTVPSFATDEEGESQEFTTTEIDVPALPGGENTTITVEVSEDGKETSSTNITVTDSNGNNYSVDYEGKTEDSGDFKNEGSSKSEDETYSAEWGESSTTTPNTEYLGDVTLDLITDGESNGEVTETAGENTTIISGDLKDNDPSNYDQTTTTTTDREVTGEVTAINSQSTIVTKEDGTKEQVTYYYYNAADENFRWHNNGIAGNAYFETTNNPDLKQHAGVYMLIMEKVTTQLNEDGTPKTDSEGNEIVSYELIPCLYCTDINTSTETGKEYRLVNLDDAVAEGYYSEEDADHLRAIISLGYDWGYNDFEYPDTENREQWSGEDKDGDGTFWDEVRNDSTLEWKEGCASSHDESGESRGTQSLEEFKQTLKTAVSNGELDLTDEQIDSLTRGQAATATQVAIWQYGKRDYTTVVSTDDEVVNAIAEWLAKQTTESNETQIIDEEKSIDDFQLIIGEMVQDNEFNQDADDTNDVYEASLKFSLVVTPTDNDDLIVKVVDSNGTVIRSGRIAGLSEDPNEEYLTADENGYYTFDNLELQENTNTKFNLTIEGTQYLEEGVYVFKSTNNGTDSQNLITKYEGNVDVNTTTEIDLTFNVEESTITRFHEWRSENIITEPDNPEEPKDPEIPKEPDEPEQPTEPEEPSEPEQPGTPEEPNNPETPDKPEESNTPDDSKEPEDTNEPETPEEPKEPEETESPNEPKVPEETEVPEETKKPEIPETEELPKEPEETEIPKEPEETDAPETTPVPDEPNQSTPEQAVAPQTGDNGTIIPLITLIISAIGIMLLTRKKRVYNF